MRCDHAGKKVSHNLYALSLPRNLPFTYNVSNKLYYGNSPNRSILGSWQELDMQLILTCQEPNYGITLLTIQ